MKKTIFSIAIAVSAALVSSCYGIDDENYKELAPIEITAASDTINTTLGETLVYTGITVKSDLECTYEWVYGEQASSTSSTTTYPKFQSYTVISDELEINYAFSKIGSYVLRLEVDNGESIEFKYFTLNINMGFDEGIAILSNDDSGNGALSFIKTLTSEESANGEQEVYYDIFESVCPGYTLKNGTNLFMSDNTMSSVRYSALLLSTGDENGTIYFFEPQTFELYSASKMSDYGTYCVEFGGEYASSGGFGNFFRSADGRIFRFDMQLGYLQEMTDFSDWDIARSTRLLTRSSASSKSSMSPFFLADEAVITRQSASAGVRTISVDGYEPVNVSCKRTGSNPVYALFRNIEDPTQYVIKYGATSWRSVSDGASFTTDDLKMDRNSKIVNTKSSSDVYYTYDNAIYRWGLTSAPGTSPAITVPS